MKTTLLFLILATSLGSVTLGCGDKTPKSPTKPPARDDAHGEESANPLLKPWKGPLGGVPPFGEVELAHFEPALNKAMNKVLVELDRIGAQEASPTFENTILAMEKARLPLHRVRAVYGVWRGAKQTPGFQKLQRKMAPKLAAFSDKITQNLRLFKRVQKIYEGREEAELSAEQKRLVKELYRHFVRSGAKLESGAKKELSKINQNLAKLYTRFGQNVLADENKKYLVLEGEKDLAGIPASLRQAAKAKAKSMKMPDRWIISNTRSSVDPFLTYSDRRDLREKAWRMFINRGDFGGKTDNNALITKILALRARRAELLGYPTHAHWRLEETMAKKPEAVLDLLMAVWKPAVARVKEEVAQMQAIADAEGKKFRIQPWDYHYYAEKVRKKKYNLDESQIKPYMQLSRLQKGTFWVAEQLFGFEFKKRDDVPVFHEAVTVYEVTHRETKKTVGLFYYDPWARSRKRSGAWMTAYRVQHRLGGEVLPIVSNNTNFLQGKPKAPVLISWDDARTLFHEFGHALHGLSSQVTYPSLAGTAVPLDYVEFPSQFVENLLDTPQVLNRFAKHHKTGEPIPKELVQRIQKASTFKQGFKTVEFLASAIMDMKLHLAGAKEIDPDTFERETLASLGMPKELVMRHRTPHFLHVFAGESYSSGYYSYLWADVITADALEAFEEAGNAFDPKLAKRLYDMVFSVGNTIPAEEGFRRFRGRDPKVDALMRQRGFAPKKGASKATPSKK